MSVSGFSGEWGVMLAFFKAVQGVDYYEVEPQEVVPDFQAGNRSRSKPSASAEYLPDSDVQ
jgi:hypothetical protein